MVLKKNIKSILCMGMLFFGQQLCGYGLPEELTHLFSRQVYQVKFLSNATISKSSARIPIGKKVALVELVPKDNSDRRIDTGFLFRDEQWTDDQSVFFSCLSSTKGCFYFQEISNRTRSTGRVAQISSRALRSSRLKLRNKSH
jgi:hypothetical protein